jgi:predicted Fe-S protein YdhL (DUF1289 family)
MDEKNTCSGCGRTFSKRGLRAHQSGRFVAAACRPPRSPEEIREDRVKTEYEALLTAAILKHGTLVSKDASYYGWQGSNEEYAETAWRGPRHSVTCGIASTGRVEEHAAWSEFAGTFASNDYYKHGMEVHGVTCNCGKLTDRVFRWDSHVGEAIRLVMMELLEERVDDRQG